MANLVRRRGRPEREEAYVVTPSQSVMVLWADSSGCIYVSCAKLRAILCPRLYQNHRRRRKRLRRSKFCTGFVGHSVSTAATLPFVVTDTANDSSATRRRNSISAITYPKRKHACLCRMYMGMLDVELWSSVSLTFAAHDTSGA